MNETANPATEDRKDSRFAGPCPRCSGPVPSAAMPGAYPGALSRYDNETYICSACGSEEAMLSGHLVPFSISLVSDEATKIRNEARK